MRSHSGENPLINMNFIFRLFSEQLYLKASVCSLIIIILLSVLRNTTFRTLIHIILFFIPSPSCINSQLKITKYPLTV